MSASHIPAKLRREIRAIAKERCEYCQSAELLMGVTFEVDHIIPVSAGGKLLDSNEETSAKITRRNSNASHQSQVPQLRRSHFGSEREILRALRFGYCREQCFATSTNRRVTLGVGQESFVAGNSKEADKQFILVLQKEPDNKEAWFWHGVCTNHPESMKTCWEKTGFTRDQIINYLANVMSGRILLNMFLGYFLGIVQTISGNEDQAIMYLDAALKAKRDPVSRKDFLEACELLLSPMHYELNGPLPRAEKVRDYSSGLLILFNKLGPDQPSDVIKGGIVFKGLFGRESREVQEKPSYWWKYVQQTIDVIRNSGSITKDTGKSGYFAISNLISDNV